jgi:hypothetical protein
MSVGGRDGWMTPFGLAGCAGWFAMFIKIDMDGITVISTGT